MMTLTKILSQLTEDLTEEEDVSDNKLAKRSLDDEFDINDAGLDYIKRKLEKLNKKAGKLGTKPLELKIISSRDEKVKDDKNKMNVVEKRYVVKIEGTPPIISGYEFIASIEHTSAGNIVNVSPGASIKNLPDEYHSTMPTCDYCKTKRDRINTFVLLNTKTKKFIKVGRGCLKNFLPDKNPEAILHYAEYLSSALRELIAAEDVTEERGFGGGWSKYYDAEVFLYYVCLAYTLTGKFVSRKMLQQQDGETMNDVTTGNLATTLMNMHWSPRDIQSYYEPLMKKSEAKAKELEGKLKEWIKTKNWEEEKAKNPNMTNFLNNLEIILKSNSVQYKNANYHAAVLALYLRDQGDKARKEIEKQNPKNHVGRVGEKITFIGVLKAFREFERQKFGYYDSGIGYIMVFNDIDNQNEIVYFTNNPTLRDEDVNNSFKVVGTVKKHDYSKFNKQPQTIITRAKITPA